MKTPKYKLQQLIEPENLNPLLELFNKTTGFVTAILDLEGNVLAKSGWRELCTLFHRAHPETSKKCTESDTVLANQSSGGEKFHTYHCLNGLVDMTVPIMIEGEKAGNLFTGQFLTEEPDPDFFRKQAAKYGFDEKQYLEALQKVPVVSMEKAKTAMEFLHRMIEQFLEKNLQKIKKEKAEEQLQLSEEKFRLAFQSNPDARGITRLKDGVFLDINEAFTKIIGHTREDVIGKPASALNQWADPQDRERLVKTLKEEGMVVDFEARFRTKSGKIINGLMSSAIITINGEPCTITVMRDITDIKKTEDSLRKTTSQLESIYDSVHDVIFYLGVEPDENYRFLSVNRAFLAATGLKREQVEGRLVDEVIPEPSLTLVKGNYKKAIEEKRMLEWEETTPYPEGLKYGIVNVVPVFDESGKCTHLVGAVHDITERKKAEETIKESELRFRTLIEQSAEGISMTDEAGNVIAWNDSMASLTGLAPAEVLGQKIWDVQFRLGNKSDKNPEEYKALKKSFLQFLETGEIPFAGKQMERTLTTPSGEEKIIQGSVFPIKTAKGFMLASISRDVTKQKQAEEIIKSSEANLKALINNREDYIWSLDRDYRYIAFNSTYADMFYNHYKTECKTGLNSLDFLSEDEKTFWVGVCERAFTGEHVKFEYSYDLGKGMQYFQTSINPIYEEEEITGLSLISVEITDQVKITQRFKALFEYAPVPLWEEDFSGVKQIIDGLKKRGVKNFRQYFDTHPEVLEKCIQSVKILEVNRPVLKLHEADSKEELFAGLDKIFTNESVIGFKEELIAIAEGNSTAQFDAKVKTLKGNERDIHLIWNVVPGYEDTLERIYVSTEDITERKKAEEELRLSRERLIRAQRIAKMGDYTWDVDTGEVTWSDSLFELLKYDKNEVIDYAKVNAEIHHPEDLERVTQWLAESVASGKDVLPPNEYRIIRKDGETIYIRTEGIFERSGGKTRLFATLYDITERKLAEEEIKTINKRLTDILENMSDAFVALDRNWCYTYMNEKAAKIFNRNAKEMIGKHIWTEFPEGVGQPFHRNYEKAMNERVFIQLEEYYPPYDKWFENRINPTNEGIAIFFNDITQRKKQEKELKRLNEELQQLNRDLEKRVLERTAELREANRELEEFAYSISHDLRAPLRSISGFSEIIAKRYKTTLNAEALQYFEFIREASKNMSNLIDDLLRFARLAKHEITKGPVSLKEVFDNVLQDLQVDILKNKAEIKMPENLPAINSNRSLLLQIFSNLIINAIT
ncbi:MAG: hypothetical protein Kow00127_07690 [Bacteroidales bacterium]